MAETLKTALETRGPYAIWDLLTDDEKRLAARAMWTQGDRDTRAAIELALAKEMKFRPQSLRKLGIDTITTRLVRLAPDLPDSVVFQFLFHLHLADRRPLLAEFLDAVGLPHDEGILALEDDTPSPDPETVATAAGDLVTAHGHEAAVYLATLRVADAEMWEGVEKVLETLDENGEKA